MIAADIDDCIADTQAAIQHWASGAGLNLHAQLLLWESGFGQFDEGNEGERTVRDWKIPTRYQRDRVPNAAQDQSEYASDVFLIVYGAVCAGKYAELAGRITTAQRDQMVADWNTAFGF